MKMRKALRVMIIIFLLLVVLAGALFMERPSIIDRQRLRAENRLMSLIESGQTSIESMKLPPVEGEDSEFNELGKSQAEPVEITGYGLIEIPDIELKMAVVEGADSYSLRAAAGWLPSSAGIGQAGNCAIFGHRMYEYGRHFNRLDELEEGDDIILYNSSGERFTYTVSGKSVIEPWELMDSLAAHNEGFGLTLVTCTPTGVGSHRLLVYAEITNWE